LFQGLTRIVSQTEVMPGIFLLQVEAADIAARSRPGQFVMISCDSGCARLLRRPISIHRVEENRVYFLYAAVGEGTEWLSGRLSGEHIDILGPMGNGFTIDAQSKNILLVAGGMGVAPLCFLAEQVVKQGKSVKVLEGAKTASMLLLDSYLPEGVERIITTEDGSAGTQGMVTNLLTEQAKWAGQIFCCGPLPMYRSIHKNYLNCLKDKLMQVSLEVRMGCGLGFCYACTIKTQKGLKQVCKDGPVFNFEVVIWDELK
jgi:dihydroorotate dehydrogenase electron transfer subunit